MNKLFALVGTLAACVLTAPAQAQSVFDVINSAARIGNSARYGSYCNSYGNDLYAISCSLSQLNDVGRVVRTQQRNADARQRTIIEATQRACRAGDQQSCQRLTSSGLTASSEINRALLDACQAGDRVSCDRIGYRNR